MLQLSQSGTRKAESSARYFTHGGTFNQLHATFSLQVDFEKQDVLFPYAVTWEQGDKILVSWCCRSEEEAFS